MGIAECVGHGMTYWTLTEHGNLIARAVVRSAIGPERNLRLDSGDGDDSEDSDADHDPAELEY